MQCSIGPHRHHRYVTHAAEELQGLSAQNNIPVSFKPGKRSAGGWSTQWNTYQNTDRGRLYRVLWNEVRTPNQRSLNTWCTIEEQMLLANAQHVSTHRHDAALLIGLQRTWMVFVFWDWPRESRRFWGGPVVRWKKREAQTERGAHWAGSGTESEARQSHTLSASLNASSSGWSGKERKQKENGKLK